MMRTIMTGAILAMLAAFLPASIGSAAESSVKFKQAATAGSAEAVAMLERLRPIIVDLLGVDPADVTAETRLIDDLGMDELDIVELVMAVEDEFGITVPDDTAEGLVTVGDVVAVIQGGSDG